MSYDDIIEVLAAALLEKAETVGCLEVLDGFSQRPDTEIEVSAPISEEMLALPLDKQEWPEECTPILKESSAATLGELVEYLKIDELPPNRLYGHTDFLAGSFFVCGSRRGDFVSLTDKQFAHYEKIYHHPIVFLPTPHGLLPMKCTPEQYEQFQRDGNKLKVKPIDHGER